MGATPWKDECNTVQVWIQTCTTRYVTYLLEEFTHIFAHETHLENQLSIFPVRILNKLFNKVEHDGNNAKQFSTSKTELLLIVPAGQDITPVQVPGSGALSRCLGKQVH